MCIVQVLVKFQDPQHFGEDATKFDPENFFDPTKRDSRSPYAFLSFGQGPRNCVGMRFAMLQMKSLMVRVLGQFEVVPCDRTAEKLEVDPKSPTNQPKGGIWLKVNRRS